MRLSLVFAALTATVAASPIDIFSRATCTPPATVNGITGPFKIQVSGTTSKNLGQFARNNPTTTIPNIVFVKRGGADFYLDTRSGLLLFKNDQGQTLYGYNNQGYQHIALTKNKALADVKCSLNKSTCELDCKLPDGSNTDCVASPREQPDWRVGPPRVVKPGCQQFTPLVIAS